MNWGALNDGWMRVSQIKLFHNYINCPALLTLNYPIMRQAGKPEVWKWVKIKRVKFALARRNDVISSDYERELSPILAVNISSISFVNIDADSLSLFVYDVQLNKWQFMWIYFHTLPPYYLSSDLEWWFCDYDRDKRAPKDGESREAAKATTTTSLSGTDKRRAEREES